MTKPTSHDSDVSFIRALAELLRANDLTELQVKRDYGENDSQNVRVSRQMQVVLQQEPEGKIGDPLPIIAQRQKQIPRPHENQGRAQPRACGPGR